MSSRYYLQSRPPWSMVLTLNSGITSEQTFLSSILKSMQNVVNTDAISSSVLFWEYSSSMIPTIALQTSQVSPDITPSSAFSRSCSSPSARDSRDFAAGAPSVLKPLRIVSAAKSAAQAAADVLLAISRKVSAAPPQSVNLTFSPSLVPRPSRGTREGLGTRLLQPHPQNIAYRI